MGLAEQRKKQRIGEDPQNLNWSTNTSRFGFKMLEKMGWAPGKGLGAQENGTLQHIKATVKTNQRGLGADIKTSDNWIDNTSGFSQLLAKLNTTLEKTSGDEKEEAESSPKPKKEKKVKKDKKSKKESKASKSKRENSEEGSDAPSKKAKKDKKSKKDKKEKKESKETEVIPPVSNLRLRYIETSLPLTFQSQSQVRPEQKNEYQRSCQPQRHFRGPWISIEFYRITF